MSEYATFIEDNELLIDIPKPEKDALDLENALDLLFTVSKAALVTIVNRQDNKLNAAINTAVDTIKTRVSIDASNGYMLELKLELKPKINIEIVGIN